MSRNPSCILIYFYNLMIKGVHTFFIFYYLYYHEEGKGVGLTPCSALSCSVTVPLAAKSCYHGSRIEP